MRCFLFLLSLDPSSPCRLPATCSATTPPAPTAPGVLGATPRSLGVRFPAQAGVTSIKPRPAAHRLRMTARADSRFAMIPRKRASSRMSVRSEEARNVSRSTRPIVSTAGERSGASVPSQQCCGEGTIRDLWCCAVSQTCGTSEGECLQV
jgi:hypothetical protein